MFPALWHVLAFEGRRTQTRDRIVSWLALALFPSLLMILLQSQSQREIPSEPLAIMSFYLVVQIGCMLGLLLWATPAIGSELEAQTWVYVAVRPHGKLAILLGKYLVATAWTASAGILSAVGIAFASQYPQPLTLAGILMVLVILSSVCYAALYVLIGVAFSARSTVVAVVYTLLFEGVLSNIPATINQFTVCYRLRSLLAEWGNLTELRQAIEELFATEPVWQHLVCIAAFTFVSLGAAILLVHTKEFPVNIDS